MKLNLIKLCVGVDSIDVLAESQKRRRAERKAAGEPAESRHITRMTPRRRVELLDGGSLYWVISGYVQVRQRILRLDEVHDADGIRRCAIVLHPELVRTQWRARRPFQGWRYLPGEDAPPDLPPGATAGEIDEMPTEMQAELRRLGLI